MGGNAHLLQDLRRNGLAEFYVRQITPQSPHGALPCQCREVRSNEPVCDVGDLIELHIPIQRHASGVDHKYLQPALGRGYSDLYLPVEPAGSSQGRVDRVLPVRGCYDYHIPPGCEPVHQREQLRHHAPLYLSLHFVPLRGDGIHLVYEDDRGCVLLRLREHLAEPLLTLPVELGHYLRALDCVEVRSRLVGHGPGDKRLPRSWGAVQ